MEKIIQINYQGRNISIEENAYNAFQQYENELKDFFLNQEGGEETFADLQYRMAEILEQKNAITTNAVNIDDINELIATIGKPSDLDGNQETEEKTTYQAAPEKKKLYRNKNKNEKVIAGVCSGIAHYFSIDPIAVRIAFVVFTIFNIATFFSFNVGILGYILFWVLLEPAYIKTNIARKLFRNPKDKVVGGVCSGLAQFFNSESWIVRLIFAAPIILGMATNNMHFGGIKFHFLGHSFFGLAIILYLILLVIVPVAKSPTDYMLLKGEPINISTIQNSTSMSLVTQNSNSGLSKFLKIVAYILIFFFLICMIPIAFTLLVGSIFSYNLGDVVLFSSLNKTLALFTLLFFVLLPFVGIIIWFIRKIAGYNKPNRPLRIAFIGLNILGWVSAMLLIANIGRENNTYLSIPVSKDLNIINDTLYIEPLSPDSSYTENVVFEMNQFDHLLERGNEFNKVKAVRLKYKETDAANFSMTVERSAFGRNKETANKNAMITQYDFNVVDNKVYLPSMLSVPSNIPYHFQNVKVTIYIPKGKTLIISEKMKKQLRHSLRTNHKNFEFHFEDDDNWNDEDEIITSSTNGSTIVVDDNVIRINEENKENSKEYQREMEDAAREAKLEIEESQRQSQLKIEEAQRELQESQREAQLKIDEAKRELEQSKREAQLKIDEAKRNNK